MADLPFPITGSQKQQTELMMRLFEEMFEERVGGGYIGDVFQIDSDDVLSINLSDAGGLTKSGSELAILNNPTGGLSSTADGERVKLKTGGGLSTDVDGLYIADAYYSFGTVDCPAGTDPKSSVPADTLTLANGTGISITGNSATNTVTVAVSGVVLNSVYDANTILKADSDNTPEAMTVGEQTLVGRITGGEIAALSASQVRTLLDVPTNAEAVLDTLFNANTILKADSDNTPEALTVGVETLVGRITGGEITALNASQVRTLLDVPTNAEAVLDTLFNANTILKADSDDTPEALTVGEGTIVGRAAGGEITALDNVTRGYREGLLVTIKDADELYVSGGTIEINGTVYESEAQLTVSLSGVSANTLYYLYVAAPGSGLTLTASEITVSATAPTFDDARGAYYKTGDATKRLLAKYYQAGGNFVLASSGTNGGYWNQTSSGAPQYPPSYPNLPLAPNNHYRPFVMFPSVGLQNGDTITSATLTMKTSTSGNSAPFGFNIYFNDADNATLPVTFADTQALAYTTAKTTWNFDSVSNSTVYTSPDIAASIQEVIDRAGWNYGNNLMFILKDNEYGGSSNGLHFLGTSSAAPPYITMVINSIGVSKVIDSRRVGIGMDSDNVLNDEELLAYDTLIGGFKGVAVDDTPVNGETTVPISSNWAYDHVAAADPHEGYRLETADHTHATTGAEAGQLDHGAAMTAASLLDDDHTQYVLAAGDTLTGQMALSGSGITYFKERPRIELSRVLSVSKPSIVFRGTIRGFSLPVYSSDNEELFLDLPNVPARWDGASDPIVYIQGYLDTANTSKKFKLACDWTYFSAGDEPDGVAVESPSVETTTATWGQYHTFTAAITLNYDVVAANALAVGDFLQLRVYRIAASGDEIAGEVVVTGVAIKWRMDKLYSSS